MSYEESFDDIIQRLTEPDGKFHLIGLASRPGLHTLLATIEFFWYPPDTIKNELFEFRVVVWEGITWMLVSIPRDRLASVLQVAKVYRLTLSAGSPAMIGGTPGPNDEQYDGLTIKYFPGSRLNGKNNPNVFTVESSKNNPLHNTSETVFSELNIELVQQRERTVINALQHKIRPTPLQMYNYIYGFEPKPNWLPDDLKNPIPDNLG